MYDRDALIAAVDLRALADDLLGTHSGTDRSPTWRCPNAKHAQTGRTPPVNVFTSRRGEQRWRCHGCGAGGTALDLVMACRGTDLRGALDHLAERAGHTPEPPRWDPSTRWRPEPAQTQPATCRDPEGLNDYVKDCAHALWKPGGRAIRRWLTERRGLPAEVLRANKVGADLGPRRQIRPDGMPSVSGAVLPVIAGHNAIYAQLRLVNPRPDRPRYLNPTAELAPNPRIARFRPVECEHPEVIITEGAIDALSAAAAGYRAIAVLSAGYPDQAVAHALSRLPHPLVIAFDPDSAGQAGGRQLMALLEAQHRPPAMLHLTHGDLNDTLIQSRGWPEALVREVARSGPGSRGVDAPGIGR